MGNREDYFSIYEFRKTWRRPDRNKGETLIASRLHRHHFMLWISFQLGERKRRENREEMNAAVVYGEVENVV